MMPKRKAKRVCPAKPSTLTAKTALMAGYGNEMPPQKQLVEIYFDQREIPEQAKYFFDHYEKLNWSSSKGTPYRNWKLLASDWIFDFHQQAKLVKRRRANQLIQL